jgi:hypothetical protein
MPVSYDMLTAENYALRKRVKELEQYQLDCKCADFAVENDELRVLLSEAWNMLNEHFPVQFSNEFARRVREKLEKEYGHKENS